MPIHFRLLTKDEIPDIIPLLARLGEHKVPESLLRERLNEMRDQNYECMGVFDDSKLIGMSGMWFQTRHYAGPSVEIDHVYIDPEYRNSGLGTDFMNHIESYAKSKGCQAMELNTYVENYPSHKFYYNKGFVLRGYHFYKIY